MTPTFERCGAYVPGNLLDPVGCELPLWHDGLHALLDDGKVLVEWHDPLPTVPPAHFVEPTPVELADAPPDPGVAENGGMRGLLWALLMALPFWLAIAIVVACVVAL